MKQEIDPPLLHPAGLFGGLHRNAAGGPLPMGPAQKGGGAAGALADTNLVRDVEKEQALKDLLERYLPSMEKDEENGQEDCERYIIENGDDIGRFLEFCLPQLYSFGSVVLEDGLADLHFDDRRNKA